MAPGKNTLINCQTFALWPVLILEAFQPWDISANHVATSPHTYETWSLWCLCTLNATAFSYHQYFRKCKSCISEFLCKFPKEVTRAAHLYACVWNTFNWHRGSFDGAGGRSQQSAVFTAIWAFGPVYTTQGSSVSRLELFLHLALTWGVWGRKWAWEEGDRQDGALSYHCGIGMLMGTIDYC